MIIKCNCKHLGQDTLHGKGRRVHNKMKAPDLWRCTVCRAERMRGDDHEPTMARVLMGPEQRRR